VSSAPPQRLSASARNLNSFVSSVRQQLLWKSRLNLLQISTAVGCAAAILWSILLILQGRPVLPACALVVIGLVIGIVLAAFIHVSPFQAAMDADRRYGLADLLASAWSVREKTPVSEALIAMADARCKELNPAKMGSIISRPRAWAVTSLAAALVIALAFFPAKGASSVAVNKPGDFFAPESSSGSNPEITQLRPNGAGSTDEPSNRATGDLPSSEAVPGGHAIGNEGLASSSGNDSASAGGVGRTSVSISKSDLTPANGGNSLADGITASGGDLSDGKGQPGDSGAYSGNGALHHPLVAAWQSNRWPTAQAAAIQSIQNGRIDPAYQDIVREYFQHP
jgi:hypothetical protein